MRSTVMLVYVLLPTKKRCSAPSVFARFRTTRVRKRVALSLTHEVSGTKPWYTSERALPRRRARSTWFQPCVYTYVFENDEHVLKSICSVNGDIHRALTENVEIHNCVRLSPMRGLFQRMGH